MRAVAQDTEASAMMGINVNRTISVTFAIAGALAAAAAIVYLLQFNMRYDTGFELGLIAFTAAVLGGIGNLNGAVLGALVIGFIQAFNEGLTWHTPGSDWTRSIVFGILIAILVFRPRACSASARRGGLTGRPAAEPRLRRVAQALRAAGAAARLLAFLYPQYVDSLHDWPLIGDFVPSLNSVVIMIVFTMMAVGLNIVVGYAGLLDLGYVAFYAAGAYVAAWFASQQFDQWTFHFGEVGISKDLPGIHLSIWLVLLMAGLFTMLVGILIGLPTLRLRGDYLAIVTLGFGEIVPQAVRNGDNVFGFDLTHGTFGISPIDSPGFGVR